MVTGASRGIGAAAARCLARGGRKLILVSRNQKSLQTTEADLHRLGADTEVAPCDLGDPEQVRQLLLRFPDLEGLILNAGLANGRTFLQSSSQDMAYEMQVNYLTPTHLLRHHLERMVNRRSGTVVAVGSLTSFVPFPGNASYAASKSALYTLLRSLRVELKDASVGIGMVLAGYTDTAMTANMTTRVPAMSADEVGRSVARCYERPAVMIPGFMNRAAAGLFGAFPESSDSVFSRLSHFLVPTRDA